MICPICNLEIEWWKNDVMKTCPCGVYIHVLDFGNPAITDGVFKFRENNDGVWRREYIVAQYARATIDVLLK